MHLCSKKIFKNKQGFDRMFYQFFHFKCKFSIKGSVGFSLDRKVDILNNVAKGFYPNIWDI